MLSMLKQRFRLMIDAFTKPVPEESVWVRADSKLNAAKDYRQNNRVNAKSGTRVLVIDDSKTVVGFLSRLLKQNGYEMLEAGDAETGVELAKTGKPDLIFLDIVLPGMNGFAALRLLRRDPSLRQVPVIMMSGNVEATEEFYLQSIGADDFLKKPFSRAEVCARVEQLLDENLKPCRPKLVQSKSAVA